MSYTRTPAALDDAAFGVATDYVSPAGYLVDEVASDSADEGDIGLARMNANRIQLAELRTGNGDSAMDEANDAVRVNIVAGAPGSPSAVTIADGADVAQGTTTNAAVTTDTNGTVIGFLRGLVKIFASVWDSGAGRLKVDASAVAVPVTDNSGSLTVDGTVAATQGTSPWVVGDGGGLISVDDGGGSLTVDGTVAVSGSVAVTGPLTDAQLRATPVPVSGTVTITDGSGPVTVDGTVAATQSGTWTVQPGNTANTTAWKVDGSAVTQPVSGSVTVSGTATVSGTVSVDNITTSVTPGTAAGNLGKAEDAVHASGDTGVMGLTVRKDTAAATAGTDGDYQPAITDATGRTWVNTEMPDAALLNDTLDTASALLPTIGTVVLGMTQGATTVSRVKAHDQQLDARSNLINGLAVNAYGYSHNLTSSVGERNRTVNAASGTTGTGVPAQGIMGFDGTNYRPVKVDTGGVVLPGTGATNLGKAEDATHTSGDTGVMGLAVRNDTRGSLAGTDGDYAPLQLNSGGDLRVDASGVTVAVLGSVTVSSLTSIADKTTSGNITGAGVSVIQATTGCATAMLHIEGAWTGTIQAWELETLSGLTQVPLTVRRVSDNTILTSITANGVYEVAVSGQGSLNVIGTAWTSGTATVVVRGSVASTPALRSVVPGTGATQLGKAEDDAHASGDTGVMALAVRRDTDDSLSGTSGDYTPFQVTPEGSLKVAAPPRQTSSSINATATVRAFDIHGTSVVVLEITGVVTTGKLAFTVVGPSGLEYSLQGRRASTGAWASSLTGVSSEIVEFNVSGYYQLWVTSSLWGLGDAVNLYFRESIGVSGVRVASLNPGTGALDLGKAEDAAHASGDTGVMALGVRNDTRGSLAGTDGDYVPPQMNASGDLRVAPSNPASTITSVDFSTIADASRVLTLLAANVSRRAAVVSNDTDATLYIKEGSSASLTSYSDILPPGCRYLLESTSILTAYVPAIPSGQILVTERA